MLTTAAVGVLCAMFVAGRNVYFAERRQAHAVLAGVEGISNIHLQSCIDVTEEVNSVTFALDGRPDSVIELGGWSDYENSGRFYVGRIGKWTFRVSGRRHMSAHAKATGEPVESEYFGGHIELGPHSPYSDLFPFEVNTLQDLVDHYQDLVELLETWPRESAAGTVTLDDGSTQYYYVIEDQVSSTRSTPALQKSRPLAPSQREHSMPMH